MAKVDVVVPCYNYGHFLEQCIISVLDQSIRDVRILIIDDASSDNSAFVAQKIAADDRRVNVRIHPKNEGHIRTYNEGIDWADSEYFLLLSADDVLAPGAFYRATSIMDQEPRVVLTHGTGVDWKAGAPFPAVGAEPGYTWTQQNLVREMCAVGANLVSTPTAIGRTETQKSIGGYRASLPHTADMEMWLRFAARGSVAHIHAVQAIYRRHSTNMSNTYYIDYWHRKAAFDSFFDEFVDCQPQLQNFRAQASRALAEQAFRSGANLIRSSVRLARWDRVGDGLQLLRLAKNLNPRLPYRSFLGELLRMPGLEGREWAVSIVRRAAARLHERAK
jgi:glycosyltransferase involved in cell wall biosynthesis